MESYVLSKLVIHNFGPFKGTHVIEDIDLHQLIAVVGSYKGVSGKSNRSGKSMALEAVLYLLTGKSRASNNERDLIHYGEEVMYVEGLFVDEHDKSNSRKIRRGRDHTGKGLLELDWIEKTRDAKQAIIDDLGVDPRDFQLTAFFEQSDIEGFMSKKPSEQTEDLMRWLDNSHWLDKSAQATIQKNKFTEKLREVEASKKALGENVTSIDALEISLENRRKEIADVENTITLDSDDLTKFKNELNETRGLYEQERIKVSKLQERIRVSNENIGKKRQLTTKISEMIGVENKLQAEVSELLENGYKSDKESIEKDRDHKSKLQYELSDNRKVINSIKSNKGICPILGTSCGLIAPDSNDTKGIEDRIVKIDKEISLIDHLIERKETYIVKSSKLENLGVMIDREQEFLKSIVCENVNELEGDIKASNITQLANDIKEIENDIRTVESNISNAKKELARLYSEVKLLEHRISETNSRVDKIDELEELAVKYRNLISDLSIVATMFSKYGIPADEIDNSLGMIEDSVNDIFKLAGLDITMSISPDVELKQKEDVCSCGFIYYKGFRGSDCPECGMARQMKRKTELNIKIIEDGRESKFHLDSGGGKVLIAFAMRLAINLLRRDQNKMKLNILFLDEVDAPFDDYHLDKLINIITKTLIKSFQYGQIFIISHNSKIRDSVEKVLHVTRYEDNTSDIMLLD